METAKISLHLPCIPPIADEFISLTFKEKMKEKEFARKMVAQLAPDELAVFDDMWADYQQYNSIESDMEDSPFGLGGAEFSVFSSIIIPVVVALFARVIQNSIDDIYKLIKSKFGKSSTQKLKDEEIKAIANKIYERFLAEQTQQNK